jgi:hypothetical protein
MVIEMRKILFIIIICFVFAMLSCSGDEVECPVAPNEPSIYELEARVIENCYILEEALEEFRSDNTHRACPYNIYSDTNDVGLTVIDYLPDGQLMENPFTGERTEPVDSIATEPGQTGYYMKSLGYPFLYYINGFGESHTIVELSNLKELEQQAIENCFIVREAVMRFALLNGGVYPCDVAFDTTPEGYTVYDLLPDGRQLVNPFTGLPEEPTDGLACTPGGTGYMPYISGGVNVGGVFTGCGSIAGITIFTSVIEPGCSYISIFHEWIYCSGDCCP